MCVSNYSTISWEKYLTFTTSIVYVEIRVEQSGISFATLNLGQRQIKTPVLLNNDTLIEAMT